MIDAHLAEGSVGEAIRQFQSYRRALADELGVIPGEPITTTMRDAMARRAPLRPRPADPSRAQGSVQN
ncbi:BTAD domain-containing putative transcriptional regulator [Amycolatopsis mediterranei]|uniref:BTAD domain-containing putative transcriptional regulator n=1 Tax=Amycolatopsis mediterranei TaxID=33910 RepID=UPI00341A54D6